MHRQEVVMARQLSVGHQLPVCWVPQAIGCAVPAADAQASLAAMYCWAYHPHRGRHIHSAQLLWILKVLRLEEVGWKLC